MAIPEMVMSNLRGLVMRVADLRGTTPTRYARFTRENLRVGFYFHIDLVVYYTTSWGGTQVVKRTVC